jgi:VacB/RNase II family 3'-5' exoribonuclease
VRRLCDPCNALDRGLAAIREQFQVPDAFPEAVLAAANEAAARRPSDHVDRTDVPFVTLDPASSIDLDQAFAIERSGNDLLLRYAIADVAWFVRDGDPVDTEAWQRGQTIYLPDGKSSLYPPVLSEGVASLLPNQDRPAALFTVRVASDGEAGLDGAERAVIRSRAKLAYDEVEEADLPDGFAEISRRIGEADKRRGAARVDPPEQEVAALGDGRYQLLFRPRLASEDRNAALSLAANLAVAKVLAAHKTGLFRVMPEPDKRAVKRLRHTAAAFGIDWPAATPLATFEPSLNPNKPTHAAFMLAIRRATLGAGFQPYREDGEPWHSAVAATYAQATAPLRRLADRYVIRAALAVTNGQPVPTAVSEAFERLPKVMARAEERSNQIGRAAIDLAEAVMLHGREGENFPAIVTDVDDRGARMQLKALPIVARVDADGAVPGDELNVRLVSADPVRREIRFERAG